MTKQVLPPCSVRDCERVADAVIKGMMLCGEHAVIEIEKLKPERPVAAKAQVEDPLRRAPAGRGSDRTAD